jgi:hypothetical protein
MPNFEPAFVAPVRAAIAAAAGYNNTVTRFPLNRSDAGFEEAKTAFARAAHIRLDAVSRAVDAAVAE